MIILIGCDGSMGQRYRAILRYLGKDFLGFDRETSRDVILDTCKIADKVILATPTFTHHSFLTELLNYNIPILCEKPIVTRVNELNDIVNQARSLKSNLTMMMQYKILDDGKQGDSHYNYFRHGSDGLLWDCLQIIGLAREKVRLGQSSPVWDCVLNGKRLSLSDMDQAYVTYVERWLTNPGQDIEEIDFIHKKVLELEKKPTWDYFLEET